VIASAPLWQRLLILVPAFVIGAGIVLAVLIVLGRAFVQSVQESGHKRLLLAAFVAVCGLVALVTYLGIDLPREG
jgi:uncharacterized membrane protein YozB (DUF420 family)